MIKIEDINISHDFLPGDIGSIIHLHGILYKKEYDYGVGFEAYVAGGLLEFYQNYNPERDRIWICRHNYKIIGSLLLMHRDADMAQFRYFLIDPAYRGIGLGKKLMENFLEFLLKSHYKSAYLWTTEELKTAISLYKRYGFKLTEEKESTAFGKPVKEMRFDLNLNIL
jgi:GNAT superfamily N-acetyltransferase